MKVLVTDKFSMEGLKIFENAKGLSLKYRPGMTEDELLEAVADVEALVVRGGTQVTEAVFAAAPCLKVVARAGIGVENMDLVAANAKGVVIMNTPFGSTTTMAEYTIAMLLALARQIPQAYAATRSGEWDSYKYLGLDIGGRTLGVIGAGKIGRMVVERALALRMRVIVHDPYISEELARQLGAELVEFDDLLARSDFISLHLPLNLETEGIIGDEALNKVKRGCYIINCAVGRLIDEEALAEALRDGRVAGAALDVFANQPPGKDHPLLQLDQVIATPQMRAATRDAQVNVTVQTAHQVVDFLQKGIVVNALNVPSVNAEMMALIRPYVQLAERLGIFQAQRCGRGITQISIEYSGAVTAFPIEPLTMAVLKGVLTPMVGSLVNFVNAAQRARERGIRVTEAKSNMAEGFSNMIQVKVTGEDGEHSVCGTVFADDDQRIVRVDGYQVEALPEGHILILHNDDRPGVIGFVGQTLAQHNINIAMMNLSRRKIQGKAISLLNVDSRISDAVIDELRSNEHILSAVQVQI